MRPGLTRRAFLARVGEVGGYGAAFATLQMLGLMPLTASEVPPIELAPDAGAGVKVVILGAGIAGLVAAWELRRRGFDCTVLEARARPGGRNWTLRGGDRIEFTDGTVQTCAFDAGNYQNAGAARLPSVHGAMLGYCRELGVALEVEINTSRSTLLQSDFANDGAPVVQRQAINDTRGHVAELLAKCIAGGALDQEFSAEDKARMLGFLGSYGPLDGDLSYRGSSRSGYARLPGAGDDAGALNPPLDLHLLLDAQFWRAMLEEEDFDWQATMFQPVGGMDRIPHAFAGRLGDAVRFESPVREIRRAGAGVRIVYEQRGETSTLTADYCVCTVPLSVLQAIPNDFSAPYQDAMAGAGYSRTYKIAWESRRFWEQDYNIYGGLSYLSEGCSPVWYPSAGLFSPRGVVVSGYAQEGGSFAALDLAGKLEASRAAIEKLHPGHGRELEKGVFVGWSRIPWSLGAWIGRFGYSGYEVMLQPDGPFYFAGDHLSHLNAWQEGAALSARRAVQMLGDRVQSLS